MRTTTPTGNLTGTHTRMDQELVQTNHEVTMVERVWRPCLCLLHANNLLTRRLENNDISHSAMLESEASCMSDLKTPRQDATFPAGWFEKSRGSSCRAGSSRRKRSSASGRLPDRLTPYMVNWVPKTVAMRPHRAVRRHGISRESSTGPSGKARVEDPCNFRNFNAGKPVNQQ